MGTDRVSLAVAREVYSGLSVPVGSCPVVIDPTERHEHKGPVAVGLDSPSVDS